MSSEEFSDPEDDDERIVSARNPELARQMDELRKIAEQADLMAKQNLKMVNEQAERIEELEAENEELRERIATLEGRVTPDPSTKEYDEMSRDERVRQVRLSCARKATNNSGKAAIDYNDVLTLFDFHPSAGYAYKLLKIAGELDGFTHEKREGENNRLCVRMDAVNDESVFHAVNNRSSRGGR